MTDQPNGAGGSNAPKFFKQPEPLTPEKHGDLRFDRAAGDYGYARDTRLVPITVREFARAALDYPIVFAGEHKRPCVVMGFQEGDNFFVSPDGRFEQDRYVPGFLRQHPFMLSNVPGMKDPIVVLDRSAKVLSTTSGEPLFEDGKPSKVLESALSFMKALQIQFIETEIFTQAMQSAGLISNKTLKVAQKTEGGVTEPKDLVDYFGIDMEKLPGFPPERTQLFYEKKYFDYIYAHAVSLQNWPLMIERMVRRQQ